MNSRIVDIIDIVGLNERYLRKKEMYAYEYLNSVEEIDYQKNSERFEEAKNFSTGIFDDIVCRIKAQMMT